MARNWHPPASGWLKLNTDGSSRGNPGESSYGGVIRDDDGCWVCGYAGNIRYGTSLASEIYGILMGLRLIRALELKKVVVETDCQAALLLISAGDQVDDSHPQNSLIKECRRDLVELGCYMVHVRRNGNRCADRMASLGGRQPEDLDIYENPPPELISFLEQDLLLADSISMY